MNTGCDDTPIVSTTIGSGLTLGPQSVSLSRILFWIGEDTTVGLHPLKPVANSALLIAAAKTNDNREDNACCDERD